MLVALVIGLAVAALVVVRQFSPRRVASVGTVLVPLGLVAFGASSIGQLDSLGLVVLAVNTLLALALGVLRGRTLRIWSGARGEALMQGTRLTLLLWVATLGVRVAASVVEQQVGLSLPASDVSALLVPVAATFAAQNIVAYLRSRAGQLVTA